MYRLVLATALVLAAWAQPALAETYSVDHEHTSVSFRVRHLFTQVQGRFDRFEGTIEFDPGNPKAAKVKGTIDVASVNTGAEERDEDLRSSRFFEVEKYPQIAFESTGFKEISRKARRGRLEGRLTIHGVTKSIVLDVAYLGAGKDPWGNERAGFSAKTTIDRKEFGLAWNETLETGGVLVGNEVTIEINAEGVLQ